MSTGARKLTEFESRILAALSHEFGQTAESVARRTAQMFGDERTDPYEVTIALRRLWQHASFRDGLWYDTRLDSPYVLPRVDDEEIDASWEREHCTDLWIGIVSHALASAKYEPVDPSQFVPAWIQIAGDIVDHVSEIPEADRKNEPLADSVSYLWHALREHFGPARFGREIRAAIADFRASFPHWQQEETR